MLSPKNKCVFIKEDSIRRIETDDNIMTGDNSKYFIGEVAFADTDIKFLGGGEEIMFVKNLSSRKSGLKVLDGSVSYYVIESEDIVCTIV